ncbi:MAG: acetyltransferase [Nevskia sp.]|nr:acetyltransferase [Nevskia sp.]
MNCFDLVRQRAVDACTRLRLWRCSEVGSGTRALGRLWIRGGGRIVLGRNVLLDGRAAPIELHATRGAVIEIGDDVIVRGGCSIEATDNVKIGGASVLEPFVKIIDNQFHPLRGDRHQRPPSVKVCVEQGVRIGEHAILLPGACVQAGARIGPHSVISRRVPKAAFVAGNPPRAVHAAAAQ